MKKWWRRFICFVLWHDYGDVNERHEDIMNICCKRCGKSFWES